MKRKWPVTIAAVVSQVLVACGGGGGSDTGGAASASAPPSTTLGLTGGTTGGNASPAPAPTPLGGTSPAPAPAPAPTPAPSPAPVPSPAPTLPTPNADPASNPTIIVIQVPAPPPVEPPVAAPPAPTGGASGTVAPNASPTLAAVNAGGTRFFGGTTLNFSDDQYYVGGNTAQVVTPIAGTSMSPVYQTERWGQFAYVIPLADGDYEVTLHEAEVYQGITGPSQRVFDVVMERGEPGELAVKNVDIWSAAGPDTAYDIVRDVRVSNGALNVEFVKKVHQAKLAGISVRPVSAIRPVKRGKDIIAQTLSRLKGTALVGATGTSTSCFSSQLFQVTDTDIVFGTTRLPIADVQTMKVVSSYYDDGLTTTLKIRMPGLATPVTVSFLIKSSGALDRATFQSSTCGAVDPSMRWGIYDGYHPSFIDPIHPLAVSYRSVRLACEYSENFSGARKGFKSVYLVGLDNSVLSFTNLGGNEGNISTTAPRGGPIASVFVDANDDLIQDFQYSGSSTYSTRSVTMDTAGVIRGATYSGRPGHGSTIACGVPLVDPY